MEIIKTIRHHLVFYRTALSVNLQRDMQYRLDFFLGLVSTGSWTLMSLVFISSIFSKVPRIAGYTYNEILIFLGLYRFIEGIGEAVFYRSFKAFSSDIRKGKLDLVLTKPLDTQFFISVRYTLLTKLGNSITGFLIFIYGITSEKSILTATNVFFFITLLITGFIFYYSFWFLINTFNFWLVKVDNLRNLIHSLVGISRFPPEAYGKSTEFFLNFVLPISVVVAFPGKALLNRFEYWHLPFSLAVSVLLLVISRVFFRFALRKYNSAGG